METKMETSGEPAKEEKSLFDKNADLCEFLRKNDADNAKRLLAANAPLLTYKDDSGRSAVHWAASGGCVELIKYCVAQDHCQLDAKDDMGWSPLMIATSACKFDAVRCLLSLGADAKCQSINGQTCLHYAASKNNVEIAKLLLENGCEVNARDKYGATALHRAASKGNMEVLSLLLENCGEKLRLDATDSEGNTPLHLACDENRSDAAILLAKYGSSLDIQNTEKATPLDIANVKAKGLSEKLKKASERV